MSKTRNPGLEPKIGDVLRRPNGVVVIVVQVLKDKIEWTSCGYRSRLIEQWHGNRETWEQVAALYTEVIRAE